MVNQPRSFVVQAELNTVLDPVVARLHRRVVLRRVAPGLVAGGGVGIVLGAARLLVGGNLLGYVGLAVAVLVPVAAAVAGYISGIHRRDAARAIDRQYRLKDRVLTALAFVEDGRMTEARQMQIRDALDHLRRVVPRDVVPLALPTSLLGGCGLLLLAVCLAVVPTPDWSRAAKPRGGDPLANLIASGELPGLAPLPDVPAPLAETSCWGRRGRPLTGAGTGRGGATFGYRGMIAEYFERTQSRHPGQSTEQPGMDTPF